MSQPIQPGWCDEVAAASEEPKRCFRVSQDALAASRKRGSIRGARSRYALKNLPPIDEDEP